jgi:hypothetical protein
LPLTQFLLAANDPGLPVAYKLMAAEKAATYIYPKPSDQQIAIPALGSLKDAAAILAVQRKVARAMELGQMSIQAGRDLISTLAVMLKSYEAVSLEDRLEQVETQLTNRRVVSDRPNLMIIDGGGQPNGDD